MKSEPTKGSETVFTDCAVSQDRCTDAMTGAESMLGEVLADVLRIDHLSVESHFFDELGADSLVMAKFCARVRKRGDFPPVSMKDIYQHPTVRSLAAALADAAPAPVRRRLPRRWRYRPRRALEITCSVGRSRPCST